MTKVQSSAGHTLCGKAFSLNQEKLRFYLNLFYDILCLQTGFFLIYKYYRHINLNWLSTGRWYKHIVFTIALFIWSLRKRNYLKTIFLQKSKDKTTFHNIKPKKSSTLCKYTYRGERARGSKCGLPPDGAECFLICDSEFCSSWRCCFNFLSANR